MTAPEPLDLAAIRARYASAALGLDAVARRDFVHDIGALLDLVAEQAATIARHEKSAATDGRIIADLEAINDEVRGENERLRRERTHGTTRRGCLALDCWTEFELFSADDPATGWKQALALGGYLCPEHARLLAAHLPRPRYTPQRMGCSCGWESVPVHHRGAGTELWLDHAHEVVEGTAELPPLPTTEDYRVVLRDEDSADEPHGGWQVVSMALPTLAAAVERMAGRRRHNPAWPEMRVWRRQQVWSVAAVEQVATVEIAPDPAQFLAALRAARSALDASRAPESPADAPDPSNDPRSG